MHALDVFSNLVPVATSVSLDAIGTLNITIVEIDGPDSLVKGAAVFSVTCRTVDIVTLRLTVDSKQKSSSFTFLPGAILTTLSTVLSGKLERLM